MTQSQSKASSGMPPIVRGRSLLPLLMAFKNSGKSADTLLDAYGMTFADLENPNFFIPHDKIYAIAESVARETSPDFPALVGQSADLAHSVSFGGAIAGSRTLADFVARFCIRAGQETNSVSMGVDVKGNAAIFSVTRNFTPEASPAFMDAYQVSRWITLLQEVAGSDWSAERVLLRVNRPELLPSYFFGVRAVGAGPEGYSIRFPNDWLLRKLPARPAPYTTKPGADAALPVPKDFLGTVRSIAASLVERTELSASELAAACGLREGTLNRRLATYGLSLARIVADTKCARAKELLVAPGLSVGDVAAQLGYSDATALTRAFKKWTGQTPTEFRADKSREPKTPPPELDSVTCTCGETHDV